MGGQPANKQMIERWLVPALIVAFCGIAFWLTTEFDRMPPILKRGIQPSDFPQLVAGLILLLTLLMVILEPVKSMDSIGLRSWGTIFLIPVFALISQLDLFLALGVCAASLAAWWGERKPRNLLLVGIVVPTAIFLLFDLVFRIRFPRGLLINLWYG